MTAPVGTVFSHQIAIITKKKKVNIYLLSVNNGDELVIFDVLFTSAVFLFEKAKKIIIYNTKKIAFEIQRELLIFLVDSWKHY